MADRVLSRMVALAVMARAGMIVIHMVRHAGKKTSMDLVGPRAMEALVVMAIPTPIDQAEQKAMSLGDTIPVGLRAMALRNVTTDVNNMVKTRIAEVLTNLARTVTAHAVKRRVGTEDREDMVHRGPNMNDLVETSTARLGMSNLSMEVLVMDAKTGKGTGAHTDARSHLGMVGKNVPMVGTLTVLPAGMAALRIPRPMVKVAGTAEKVLTKAARRAEGEVGMVLRDMVRSLVVPSMVATIAETTMTITTILVDQVPAMVDKRATVVVMADAMTLSGPKDSTWGLAQTTTKTGTVSTRRSIIAGNQKKIRSRAVLQRAITKQAICILPSTVSVMSMFVPNRPPDYHDW